MTLLASDFGRRALIEAALVGTLCGVVGVHVVLRRLAFFTMATTHATFPGVVLAALVGVNIYLGGGLAGAVIVALVVLLGGRSRVDDTSAVGVVLSGGFALGVLLVSAQAGFSRDLTAFLVGSILTVRESDLLVAAGVLVVVVAVLVALGKELTFAAFDPEGLRAAGFPVAALDAVLLLVVTVTVVTAVPAVGTILAVALVVAPAAAARQWSDRVAVMTGLAVLFAVAAGVAGVFVSAAADVAAGGAIVLVAAGIFVVSTLLAPRRGRMSLSPWEVRVDLEQLR